MKQGEIWYADLDPIRGSEQAGRRPVVIISGNLLNKYLGIVICCPLTSKVKRYKGNLIIQPSAENGCSMESEVLTFHIRSVSKDRLAKKIGTITESEVQKIINSLGEILRY